jgi:hypothetical protein
MSTYCFSSINPQNYVPHELHRLERAWTETNCYVDVWIEILNTKGLDPAACLSMVLAVDFDGDQWTFFKPPHEDLFELYGVDVQELNVWRTLIENTIEQLSRGRLVLAETDAFYLPDTSGTDYRTKHTKTTIGIQEIDLKNQTLGYFHNAGYYRLSGEDFVKLLRIDSPNDPTYMPLFAEFIRFDRLTHRNSKDLAAISKNLAKKHWERRPRTNPIRQFTPRFLRDVEALKAEGLASFHAYAFATLRQIGAAFELAGYYLSWLGQHGQLSHTGMVLESERISTTTKSLLMKTARAVNTKREVELTPMLDELSISWDSLMIALHQEFT